MDKRYWIPALVGAAVLTAAAVWLFPVILGKAARLTREQIDYQRYGMFALLVPEIAASILTSLILAGPFGYVFPRHAVWLALAMVLPVVGMIVFHFGRNFEEERFELWNLAFLFMAIGILVSSFTLCAALGARWRVRSRSAVLPGPPQ